ncbi:hypothetical protein BD410DRAFT_841901 [Rickenella mellea]|uniref:Zn(2)-C6 fungal-type domain-containing protein n=1 Tax=Rickenella mellea TaxID=50990 RepID=A0A4Y7PWG1_9AGAM|nr:hypothetical protein BD410DRAFT_841901 [Rickenella mellea]
MSCLISRRPTQQRLHSQPEMYNPPISLTHHTPQGQYQLPPPPDRRYPQQEIPRDRAREVNSECYTECGCLIVPSVPTSTTMQYPQPRFPTIHPGQNNGNPNYPTPQTDFYPQSSVERGREDQPSPQGAVQIVHPPKYSAKLNIQRARHVYHPYDRGFISPRSSQLRPSHSALVPPSGPPPPPPPPPPTPPVLAPVLASAQISVSSQKLVSIAQYAAVVALKTFIDGDCGGTVYTQAQESLRVSPNDQSHSQLHPSLPSKPRQNAFVRTPSPSPPLAPPLNPHRQPNITLFPNTQAHPPDIPNSFVTNLTPSYMPPTAFSPRTTDTQVQLKIEPSPSILRPIPTYPRRDPADSSPDDGRTVTQDQAPNPTVTSIQCTTPPWEPNRGTQNTVKYKTTNIGGREVIVLSPTPSPALSIRPAVGKFHLPPMPRNVIHRSPLPSRTSSCRTTSENIHQCASQSVTPKESLKVRDSSTVPGFMPTFKLDATSNSVAKSRDILATTPDHSGGGIQDDVVKFLAASTTSWNRTTPKSARKFPEIACNFCRGRKIACTAKRIGPGSACKACQRRSLVCVFPTESQRGKRSITKVTLVSEDEDSKSEIVECCPPAADIEHEEEEEA